MVVEDAGHTVADGVEDRGIGAGAGAVEGEVTVDVPPLLLEVLEEVVGVAALDGQAAGEAGVDVRVAVDQARHDDAAVGVDVVGAGVGSLEGRLVAHLDDGVPVDEDGPLLEVGVGGVAGDDPSVTDKQHRVSPCAVSQISYD